MTTKKSSPMFYIRVRKSDGGLHRVGCVIMKKANKTHVKVGWSFCNKVDNFSARVGIAKATRRLAEAPTVIKINRDKQGVYFADMMDDLNLSSKLIKNYFTTLPRVLPSGENVFGWHNINAATGAYQDLFPESRVKSKV